MSLAWSADDNLPAKSSEPTPCSGRLTQKFAIDSTNKAANLIEYSSRVCKGVVMSPVYLNTFGRAGYQLSARPAQDLFMPERF